MSYLDLEGIRAAFAGHLMEYRGYTKAEAEFAVSDFPDPYSCCYLFENYVENCMIDGEEYEKNASYTDFRHMGAVDEPPFCFYTYYRRADIRKHTVGEYMKAGKLYQREGLDIRDFPLWPDDPSKTAELEFPVRVCLGHGDGGEIAVKLPVGEKEYSLLKDCCREGEEIESFPGLEALYQRIMEAAAEECEDCDGDEDIDYELAEFIVDMPQTVWEDVENGGKQ